jgi:hypothetical protein
MRKYAVLIVLLLALITGIRPVISQASYYVDCSQGNDTSIGTEDSPWRTISYALGQVGPGDTIFVGGEICAENVTLPASGIEGSPITLKAKEGISPTIDGSGGAALGATNKDWWVIEGLTFDSSVRHTISTNQCDHWVFRDNTVYGSMRLENWSYNLVEGNEVDGSRHHGVQQEDGIWELREGTGYNIYRNNHVHDFASRGIWSMDKTHDCVFEGNYVHHIQGSALPMGINMDGAGSVEWRHVIRDNYIHDCGYVGLQFENVYEGLMENNILHSFARGSDDAHGIIVINYGPTVFPSGDVTYCQVGGENGQYGRYPECEGDITDNVIRQNLIYDVQGNGITSYAAGGVDIWGNTIYGTAKRGLLLYGYGLTPDIDLRSNIIYGSGWEDIYAFSPESIVVDEGNLLSDPGFVNASGEDFHLRAGSVAIDTGADIGLTEDLDNKARLSGADYDVGVYEYQSDEPSPTSTPTVTPTPQADYVFNAGFRLIPTPTPTNTPTPTSTPTPIPVFSIGGMAYDVDGQDGGMAGIGVELFGSGDCSGSLVNSSITDSQGNYTFHDVLAGTYCLAFEIPVGYEAIVGGDSDIDAGGLVTGIVIG